MPAVSKQSAESEPPPICNGLQNAGSEDVKGQFTAAFDEISRTEGIKVAKTPPRTPVANCFIERWFGRLRRELLDRTIIWNKPNYDDSSMNTSRTITNTGRTAPLISIRPRLRSTVSSAGASDRHDPMQGLIHEYRQAS